MADLLALRNRYDTIKSLDSVMNAMLIVTAAKAQKARARFLHASRYSEEMRGMASDICVGSGEEKKDEKNLVVVIGTNKGMCGAFNESLFTHVRKSLQRLYGSHELYLLGRASIKFTHWIGMKVVKSNIDIIKELSFSKVAQVARDLAAWHEKSGGDVYVAYNSYRSMLVQKPEIKKILPVENLGESGEDPVIEPSRSELCPLILRHYIESMLYKSIAESELGELNQRMLTVKAATDNGRDILNDLRIRINKSRQSIITSELTEIVSSFEALKEEGDQ